MKCIAALTLLAVACAVDVVRTRPSAPAYPPASVARRCSGGRQTPASTEDETALLFGRLLRRSPRTLRPRPVDGDKLQAHARAVRPTASAHRPVAAATAFCRSRSLRPPVPAPCSRRLTSHRPRENATGGAGCLLRLRSLCSQPCALNHCIRATPRCDTSIVCCLPRSFSLSSLLALTSSLPHTFFDRTPSARSPTARSPAAHSPTTCLPVARRSFAAVPAPSPRPTPCPTLPSTLPSAPSAPQSLPHTRSRPRPPHSPPRPPSAPLHTPPPTPGGRRDPRRRRRRDGPQRGGADA
jgi:hypothetical protein